MGSDPADLGKGGKCLSSESFPPSSPFSALRKLPVHDPVVHDGRGEGDALEPPGRGFQNVFRGDHEVATLPGSMVPRHASLWLNSAA